MKKVNDKIKDILNEPMRLDFIPQYRANLRYMHQWTLGMLRKTVEGDDDATDNLEEIINKTKF